PTISDTIGGNTIDSSLGIALTGTNTIQLSNGADAIAGVISGAGQLVESGAGQLILDGTNNYSGGTSITGGSLAIGNDAAAGTGTLTLGDSPTILAAGADHTLANTITLGGAVTIGATPFTLTFNGQVSGDSGSLILNGNLTLNAINTYAGGTLVNMATLSVAGNETGLGSGLLTLNDGSLLKASNGAASVGNATTLYGLVTIG